MSQKKRAVYYRVSTKKQEIESQVGAMEKYFEDHKLDYSKALKFTDKISGVTVRREGLDLLIEGIMKGDVSHVYFYKLDRLSRAGTLEVLNFMKFADSMSVTLVFVSQPFLNQSLNNDMIRMLIITLMSEFAKMERETIVERVREGLQSRKKKGYKLGPSLKFKGDEYRGMIRDAERGVAKTEICKKYKIGRSQLYTVLRAWEMNKDVRAGASAEAVAKKYNVDAKEVENQLKLYGGILKPLIKDIT